MPAFLTDDWFSTVDQLTAEAGDLNLPPALANLAINLVVTDSTGNTELALDGGKIQKGLSFMTGKIKVQGDMSQLMALQTAKPSQEQKTLFKKVLEQTA